MHDWREARRPGAWSIMVLKPKVFGFRKVSEPVPGVLVTQADDALLLLLVKTPGSVPRPGTDAKRHYDRHWTPVHVDFHVDDFKTSLAKALKAGARQEHLFEIPGRPAVAFCSDPFGHGFCLIEKSKHAGGQTRHTEGEQCSPTTSSA